MSALFAIVRGLSLSPGDFAIFGSGPLIVRGIIPLTNDLDIICRGEAWNQAKSIGVLSYIEAQDVTIASINDGRISFGTCWGIGDFDIDELIDSAEIIDGLPFVRLEHVVAYKLFANRDKDREHIAALHASEQVVDLAPAQRWQKQPVVDEKN